jgi:Dolichyl-phosphate-mannose-protein mannosyltransferase
MTSRLGRWLRDPVFLLCLTAGLLAFVVQSGELGTADTMHRLQTTHWLWTSQPQVFPNEYPEFGLHGRGGRLYSWYGIGQSLLMLPADLVGTWISHWRIFSGYEDDPAIRSIVVSYSTNILISVLTAWIAFRFLRQLRFGVRESVLGVLALLFCTTHLHYTQNMQENNYIMLLTLVGFSFQYEWLTSGSRRALVIGSAALGLNLLTRITAALDIAAVGTFLALVLWSERENEQRFQQIEKRFVEYTEVATPIYLVFVMMERAYNFYRFGSWTGTYLPIFAREQRLQDSALPVNFPWSTPFHEGFLGALFKPEKSIFLFDPLLLLAILLLIFLWPRLGREVRAYAIAALIMLVIYMSFYARYAYWAGDFSWGDRYVATAVQFVALLAVPLLLRYRENLSKFVWRGGLALIAVSFVIQIASLAFWLPLEIYQSENMGHPMFIIALRFKNIVAFALGKMRSWGLITEAMGQDPWDYVHITTWNFLPFLLRRVGAAPKWVVDAAFGVWATGIVLLAGVGWKLWQSLERFPSERNPRC